MPFQYQTYEPRFTGTIAELMMAPGRIRADAVRQQGQRRAAVAGSIGDLLSGSLQQYGQHKADAPRREAEGLQLQALRDDAASRQGAAAQDQALSELFTRTFQEGRWPTSAELVSRVGPERGLLLAKGVQAAQEPAVEDARKKAELLRDYMGALHAAGELRPQVFAFARDNAIKQGVIKPDDIPEQYSEAWWQSVANFGQEPPKPQGLMNVPAGGVVLDPNTRQPVFTAPTKAPEPPAVGSFESFVSQKYGEQPTPEQVIEARRVWSDAGRDESAGAKPFNMVVQTPEGPMVVDVNATTPTARPVMAPAGDQQLPPAPTADMRNKAEGRKLVARSITSIEELSKRILTKVGPAQRAEAVKRGAEAVFGNDPEFRTYQDARTALAGNLAVAQQGSRPSDADIKAIWLPLVPDAYRDTQESADMKWALIKTMSNVDGEAAPAAATGATDNDPLGLGF